MENEIIMIQEQTNDNEDASLFCPLFSDFRGFNFQTQSFRK